MNKELLWKLSVKNEIESKYLAKTRLSQIETPYSLNMEGELGVGKTFFCKYVARIHGVNDITSNSFLKYTASKGKKKLLHIDFYNISDPLEFFYDHIDELIDNDSIVLSEWFPHNLVLEIPQFVLQIEIVKNCERNISFFKVG
jgi:tRNA threonylcarbamoyl adenosine modification protein YjeE